ncbi:MAG: anaerobic ribonucleoside-triphosphate reductase activating protein [Oscillospiraceae bacterium]|nr:anaerobic ribonucleoside-triphosphate reductase activating protein [Oscillospiraceae bacterium]
MDGLKLRVCDLIQDSIVDGIGLRFVVFLQGCELNCPDCHNPQTHDLNGGYLITIEELLEQIDKNPLLRGVTISGGEPFLQAENAAVLARFVRERGLDVWCWTGKTWEELTKPDAPPEWGLLLEQADILVDGPYVTEKRTLALPWRGSSNQRVIDAQASLESGKVVKFL